MKAALQLNSYRIVSAIFKLIHRFFSMEKIIVTTPNRMVRNVLTTSIHLTIFIDNIGKWSNPFVASSVLKKRQHLD